MTVANNYAPIRQECNGATTSFSFDFPVLTADEIMVYKNNGEGEVLVDKSEYSVEFNTNGGAVVFGVAPEAGTVLAITRLVDLSQQIPFKTSSGFPAALIEECFDKLTLITQQQQQTLERCVKVVVTGNQTSEELIAEVYSKLDSATEVAQEATDAAYSATRAVESAEQTLSDVTSYVDASKAEINTLVTDSVNTINTTVSEANTNLDNTIKQAVDDVKAEAVAAAEVAIQDAANAAIQIATDHANTVIIPPLQEYVDSAETSASSAVQSAIAAKEDASEAKSQAESAKTSANSASTSARDAEYWAGQVQDSSVPFQSGNGGKFLGTNGVSMSWKDVAKKVSVLPVEPEEGLLYCIPEV